MGDNLYCKGHKAKSDKFREGYDNIAWGIIHHKRVTREYLDRFVDMIRNHLRSEVGVKGEKGQG